MALNECFKGYMDLGMWRGRKGGLGKGKVNQGCLGENLVLCRDGLKGTGLKATAEDGSHRGGT